MDLLLLSPPILDVMLLEHDFILMQILVSGFLLCMCHWFTGPPLQYGFSIS